MTVSKIPGNNIVHPREHSILAPTHARSPEEIRTAQHNLASLLWDQQLSEDEQKSQIREMLNTLGINVRTGLERYDFQGKPLVR